MVSGWCIDGLPSDTYLVETLLTWGELTINQV